MAQLVEQRIRNAQVVGSSPTISSKTCVNTAFSQVFLKCILKFITQQRQPPAMQVEKEKL